MPYRCFSRPLNLGRDVMFFQTLADGFLYLAHHLAAVAARDLDRLGQHAIALGVQVLEAEILQFLIDGVEAQTVGDGGVDFHGLARDALDFFARHGCQRTHVVQAVGQFD